MFGFTVHTSMWSRKNHFWIQNWWSHFVKSSDNTNTLFIIVIWYILFLPDLYLCRFVVNRMFPALHFCKKKVVKRRSTFFFFCRFDQDNLLKGIDYFCLSNKRACTLNYFGLFFHPARTYCMPARLTIFQFFSTLHTKYMPARLTIFLLKLILNGFISFYPACL